MTNCLTTCFLVIPVLVAKMKRPRMIRSLVDGRGDVRAAGLDDLGSRAFVALCVLVFVFGDVVLTNVYDHTGRVAGSSVELVLFS